MKRLACSALALVIAAAPVVANAQSSPGWSYGYKPTAGEWNNAFARKQDFLNFPVVNKNGDVMFGKLTTTASTALNAGFSILPGVAPTSPVNGDIWMTAAGLFAYVNGAVVGPFSSTTFAVAQLINLNSTTAPARLSGTILQMVAPDATAGRAEIDTFGAVGHYSTLRYDGTNAAPTAVLSGEQVGSVNGWAYNGASAVGPIAAVKTYAAENIAASHQGSDICFATTPLASVTMADSFCQQPSGGVTLGAPTGGDQGASTMNMAGQLYHNGIPGYIPSTSGAVAGQLGENPQGGSTAQSATVTFTNGSSTIAWASHNLHIGDAVFFSTTGALPTNFAVGSRVWVVSIIDSGHITVSNSFGGSAVVAGSAGSGTQTAAAGIVNTTGVAKSSAGITLSAGDWQCYGVVYYNPAVGTTQSSLQGAISTASDAVPALGTLGYTALQLTFIASGSNVIPIEPVDFALPSGGVVFLTSLANFGTSTMQSAGQIHCRRAS